MSFWIMDRSKPVQLESLCGEFQKLSLRKRSEWAEQIIVPADSHRIQSPKSLIFASFLLAKDLRTKLIRIVSINSQK